MFKFADGNETLVNDTEHVGSSEKLVNSTALRKERAAKITEVEIDMLKRQKLELEIEELKKRNVNRDLQNRKLYLEILHFGTLGNSSLSVASLTAILREFEHNYH